MANQPRADTPHPLVVERMAWELHRAYGCGPIVTPDGPGEDCPPNDEDRAAAVVIATLVADAIRQAREEERAKWSQPVVDHGCLICGARPSWGGFCTAHE